MRRISAAWYACTLSPAAWVGAMLLLCVAQPCSAQPFRHGTPYDVDWDHPPGPQIALKNGNVDKVLRSLDVRLTTLVLAAFEAKADIQVSYESKGHDDFLTAVEFPRKYLQKPPRDSYWVIWLRVESKGGNVRCTAKFQDSAGKLLDAIVDNVQQQSILETALRMAAQPVQYVEINEQGILTRCKVNAP
jgi:hypothetical protein